MMYCILRIAYCIFRIAYSVLRIAYCVLDIISVYAAKMVNRDGHVRNNSTQMTQITMIYTD